MGEGGGFGVDALCRRPGDRGFGAGALRGSFFWVPHLGYSQVMPHCLLFTPPSPLEPGHRPRSTILLRNSAILPISTILKNRELHCQKTDIQTCFQK